VTTRWLAVLLLASACVAGHSDADSAATDTAALRASARQREDSARRHDSMAMFASVPADTTLPRTAVDSLIARARAVLRVSRPTFREWPASAYAPVQPDSNYAEAQVAPLVGDFDGDSLPDVAFDGYEGRTHIMPVVLLGKDKQTVVPFVQTWEMPSPMEPMLSRVMVEKHVDDGRVAQGLEILHYASDGRLIGATVWVLEKGVFMEFTGGE